MLNFALRVVVVLFMGVLVVACATPTPTPLPSNQEAMYQEIREAKETLPPDQWDDYLYRLQGERVENWYGQVRSEIEGYDTIFIVGDDLFTEIVVDHDGKTFVGIGDWVYYSGDVDLVYEIANELDISVLNASLQK